MCGAERGRLDALEAELGRAAEAEEAPAVTEPGFEPGLTHTSER